MCDPVNILNARSFIDNCTAETTTEEEIASVISAKFPFGVWVPGINGASNTDMELQSAVWDYCSKRDICRKGLLEMCNRYKKQDTENKYIRQMCGCYLPDSEYSVRECSSSCVPFDTIKYNDGKSQNFCDGTVCAIDNVTIATHGSTVTFNQVCPDCETARCRCIVNDVNVIGSKFNITQNCPGGATCFTRTPEGIRTRVECATFTKSDIASNPLLRYLSIGVGIFALVLVLLFVVVGIISVLYRRKRPR